MPEPQVRTASINLGDLKEIKSLAATFKVSPYAMIVRLRRLVLISQGLYEKHERTLNEEFSKFREKLKKSQGGPARNRANEVMNQFGGIYVRTLFQAFYNNEIGLKKLSKLFGLKRVSYLSELESRL